MANWIDWAKAAELSPDDLARALEDDRDEIDDNPSATEEQIAAAGLGKRRPGQRGPGKRRAKILFTMRLDPDTLEAWKASGDDWRIRIQEVVAREAPRAKRRP